jgi:ABC-type multidrug transport system ATPase subunit
VHADVTFDVPVVSITGLLGRIGAVKTTTMRMLVGLSRPDDGTAQLLGEPSRLAAGVLARVGVTIDGPAFVPHLSGRRNLELAWRAGSRRWPPPALKPSLELAGLGEIELLATHCVVMNEGAAIIAGRLEDLLGTASYELEVDDAHRAVEALRVVDGVESVDPRGGQLVVSAPGRAVTELNQALVMAGVGVGAVRSKRSLEEVFLGLVGRNSAAD